ncbi:uncharacterized protein FYW47_015940 [Aplochiton taeniatus]
MTTQQQEEKRYDPSDTTLKFVQGVTNCPSIRACPTCGQRVEHDQTGCKNILSLGDTSSQRAMMSCGHAVTPESLTGWCRSLLEQCPSCKSSVVRKDLSNLNVICIVCTAEKKKTFAFCWQCLGEWVGPAPRSDHCGRDGCVDDDLEVLRRCSSITFTEVTGITGCPSVRACPTCGLRVEHDRNGCKNIECPRCENEFCFVCLKLTPECLETSSYFIPCSDGVAPRQTSIPVWHDSMLYTTTGNLP